LSVTIGYFIYVASLTLDNC